MPAAGPTDAGCSAVGTREDDVDEGRFGTLVKRVATPTTRLAALRAAAAAAVLLVSDGWRDAAATEPFRTRLKVSATSPGLAAAAGSEVTAQVECGGAGRVVSCGHQTASAAVKFHNAYVNGLAPTVDRAACIVSLVRTAAVDQSLAGATIQAVAICRR